MVESPDVPTKAKKFQYKTKYNTTWFSQESLKNYKDVVTNSKLGYFYCKIYIKYVSCSHGVADGLMRHCNSVTHRKSEKEIQAVFFFHLLFFLFWRYTYSKKMLFHKNRNTQLQVYTI